MLTQEFRQAHVLYTLRRSLCLLKDVFVQEFQDTRDISLPCLGLYI